MGNIFFMIRFLRKETVRGKTDKFRAAHAKFSSTISLLYRVCRSGDSRQVQQLLLSLSLDEINHIEPNGSTALHAASYYGHRDIVKMLLDAGACRSIRNRRYGLTPYEEAYDEIIRSLFHRVNTTNYVNSDVNTTRFLGLSSDTEWVVESKQAASWKTNLYNSLKFEKSFDELIGFLKEHYLLGFVNQAGLSDRDSRVIQWFFDQAAKHKDAEYIVKAYTSIKTRNQKMVNTDLGTKRYIPKLEHFKKE